MALNSFVIKRYIVFILCGTIPSMFFILGILMQAGLWMSYIFLILGILICVMLGNKLLRHPLTVYIEGTGIVTWLVDSTGVIAPIVSKMLLPPNITARLTKNKTANDIYERDIVHTFLVPRSSVHCKAIEIDDKLYAALMSNKSLIKKEVQVLKLPLGQEDHFDKLFTSEGKPTFIYNRYLDMFVGKSYLSKLETENTLQHSVNHLRHLVERLSEMVFHFAQYVAETMRPKKGLFAGKMKWILIAVVAIIIIIMAALFLPDIISSFSSGMSNVITPSGGSHIP